MTSMRSTLLKLLPIFALAGCKPPPVATPEDAPPAQEAAEETSPAASTKPLPSAEEVLAKAVEAVGGAAEIGAIESYYLESLMRVPAQNLSANNKLWWRKGAFLAVTEMPGVGVTRVWGDAQEIWSEDPINGKRKLEGVEAHQTRWGNVLVLAAEWKQYFDAARTQARREADGAVLIDVVLSSKVGDEVVLSYDETSGLLLEQQFSQVTPMGAMPIRVDYDEYQTLSGLQVPMHSTMDLGLMTAETTILKLQTNVPIEDAQLLPPEAAEAP